MYIILNLNESIICDGFSNLFCEVSKQVSRTTSEENFTFS